MRPFQILLVLPALTALAKPVPENNVAAAPDFPKRHAEAAVAQPVPDFPKRQEAAVARPVPDFPKRQVEAAVAQPVPDFPKRQDVSQSEDVQPDFPKRQVDSLEPSEVQFWKRQDVTDPDGAQFPKREAAQNEPDGTSFPKREVAQTEPDSAKFPKREDLFQPDRTQFWKRDVAPVDPDSAQFPKREDLVQPDSAQFWKRDVAPVKPDSVQFWKRDVAPVQPDSAQFPKREDSVQPNNVQFWKRDDSHTQFWRRFSAIQQPNLPEFIDSGACICGLLTVEDTLPHNGEVIEMWRCTADLSTSIASGTHGKWFNTTLPSQEVSGLNEPRTWDHNPPYLNQTFVLEAVDGGEYYELLDASDAVMGLQGGDANCTGLKDQAASAAFYASQD